jgi:hypothetical protein
MSAAASARLDGGVGGRACQSTSMANLQMSSVCLTGDSLSRTNNTVLGDVSGRVPSSHRSFRRRWCR